MDETQRTTTGTEGARSTGQVLTGDQAVADFLDRLSAVGREPAPPIGKELSAAMLAASSSATSLARRRARRRGAVAGAALIGLLGAGAAAADGLPDPIQRVVSDAVSRWTPFDLPYPDDSSSPGTIDAPNPLPPLVADPPETTAPTEPPTPSPLPTPSGADADSEGEGTTTEDDSDGAPESDGDRPDRGASVPDAEEVEEVEEPSGPTDPDTDADADAEEAPEPAPSSGDSSDSSDKGESTGGD